MSRILEIQKKLCSYLLIICLSQISWSKEILKKIFWSIQLGNTKLLMVVKRSIITTTIFNAKNHKKCIKILNIPAISHCKKKPMQNFFHRVATMRSKKSSQIFTIGANKYSSDILHIGCYFPAGLNFEFKYRACMYGKYMQFNSFYYRNNNTIRNLKYKNPLFRSLLSYFAITFKNR